MPVNVLTGPPCAGKTTFARAQGGTVIDLDDIEEQLGGTRHAEHSPVRAQAVEIRRQQIAAALDAAGDEDVWVIHTAPSDVELANYLAHGATVRRIDPGADVVLERARERPPHTADVIRAWYAKHAPDSAPEGGLSAASVAADGTPSGAPGDTNRKEPAMPDPTPKPFTPIMTQADLDRVIGDRLARESAKFAGFDEYKAKAEKFDAAEQEKLTELQKRDNALAEKDKTIAKLEREKLVAGVAKTKGVPEELLTGSTKEELEAAADKLLNFRGGNADGADPDDPAKPGGGNPSADGDRKRVIVEREGQNNDIEDSDGLHALRDQLFGSD